METPIMDEMCDEFELLSLVGDVRANQGMKADPRHELRYKLLKRDMRRQKTRWGRIMDAALSLVEGPEQFVMRFRQVPATADCCPISVKLGTMALNVIAAKHDPAYRDGTWIPHTHEQHDLRLTSSEETDAQYLLFLLGARWQVRDPQHVLENEAVRMRAWNIARGDKYREYLYDVFFELRPNAEIVGRYW